MTKNQNETTYIGKYLFFFHNKVKIWNANEMTTVVMGGGLSPEWRGGRGLFELLRSVLLQGASRLSIFVDMGEEGVIICLKIVNVLNGWLLCCTASLFLTTA